ncbi:MAG: Ferritin Dps family protein [candidate division TM6 bacterium GW2011_GWF2_32_72]|nr:MAG: Ferritin Dps family protein [candidate division TM6 bacterium GW2011_GWF2_32_72]
MKNVMHKTSNPLSEPVRKDVISKLNSLLGSSIDLKYVLKQAHWNVKGAGFYSTHLLFDLIAGELETAVDDIAERITALGGTALGTIQEAVKSTKLIVYPENIFKSTELLSVVAERMAQYIEQIEECLKFAEERGDMSTMDLCTKISELLQKRLWFVQAHQQ